MTQTKWFIEIKGSDHDLQRLSELDVEGWDISVSNGVYSLASPEFDGMQDLRSVQEKAQFVVSVLNGAASLYFQGFQRIVAGEPYGIRPDGTRTQFMYSNVASATTLDIEDVDPIVPGDPPTGIFGVTLAIRDDPNVQRVLRYLQYDDLWTARYRLIHETIKKDVDPVESGKALDNMGWLKEPDEFHRFWNAIHDAIAIETGDDALHVDWNDHKGVGAMTPNEAKEFTFRVVRAWLRWKYSNRALSSPRS